jgi:tRNA1(Val) A37 N6-methylase TrmN6
MPKSETPALSRQLIKAFRRCPDASVGAWVYAAARLKFEKCGCGNAPPRWLDPLARSLPRGAADGESDAACLLALSRALPSAVVSTPAFLGAVLQFARRAAADVRPGRSGRKSEPSVYTPFGLARNIVADMPVDRGSMVDPACGAGIFLLAAFQQAFAARLKAGEWPVRAARAVLADVVGVDLDPLALALAALNLRLVAWEAAGVKEDVPLDLRCADALKPLEGLEGSAASVVGNPPFVEGRGLAAEELRVLRGRFRSASEGKVNLFTVFVERGLELLRDGGSLSFILPATFTRNDRYRMFRRLLMEHAIQAIEPVPVGAFEGRVVETVVLKVRKGAGAGSGRVSLPAGKIPQRELAFGPAMRFGINLSSEDRRLLAAIEKKGVPLSSLLEVRDGISTGFQPFPKRLLGRVEGNRFVAEDGTRVPFDERTHRPVIDGGEFAAFTPVRWTGRWIEYDKRHEHHPPHPGRPFNCQLRDPGIYDRPEKLLTRQTARGLIATIDRERYFARNSVHVTFAADEGLFEPVAGDRPSLVAVCACFNSAFYERYFLAVTGEDGRVYPQVHIADLKRIPVVEGLLSPDGELHALGEELLRLHAEETKGSAQRVETHRARVERILHEAFF